MKANVGSMDRGARVVLGLSIIAAGVFFQSWWGAVGAVPLLTALIGWCPAYAVVGLSTCKAESATES